MAEHKYSWIFTILIIWPIIVNSQPGTSFMWAGVDWKANDLDNTLFWTGIIFLIIFSASITLGERNNKKRSKYEV